MRSLPPNHTHPTTERRAPDLIATHVTGRVMASTVDTFSDDFVLLGGARIWLFDAEGATGYAPDAIGAAVRRFAAARAQGLEHVVAALRSPLVRMGAAAVAASLSAARAEVRVHVVASLEEAGVWIERERRSAFGRVES